MAHPLYRPAWCLTAIVAATLLCSAALAQVPLLPATGKAATNGASSSATAVQAPDDEKAAAELRTRLAAERQQLELLDTPAGLAAGAPPGADEQSLRSRRIRTAFIVRTLEQQLADLARLSADRARRSALQQEMKAWSGFAEKPPYSILLVDRLRTESLAAETNLSGLKSRSDLLQQTADRAREQTRIAEQQLRQLAEQAESARSKGAQSRLAWDRQLAQLTLRMGQTWAAGNETARRVLAEEQAIAELEVEFARRKLKVATADSRFSPEDMDQIRAALAAAAEDLNREIDRLTREEVQRKAAAEAAQEALAAARAAPQAEGRAENLLPLVRNDELRQAHLAAVSAQLDALRQTVEFNRVEGTQWETRYAAHQSQDAAKRLTARENAQKLIDYVTLQKKLLDQQNQRTDAAVREVESRLDQARDPSEIGFLRALKAAYQERAAGAQRILAAMDANAALSQQMLAEFGGSSAPRSLAERWEEWFAIAARTVVAVWNLELLAVEDSIEVDGKVIAGTRSVTVGKVATALFMVIAGYMLAVFLARLGERLLVRRFAWQPAHAGVVSRWLLAVEFVLLLVIVLAWVKIPITVFAFLGGAVAIGLGFGMQTLLKNLISGLMILGEQPFRLGDTVEIGGIRGTVTNIGLRASTVSDVNGIDTIIPNSTFIEQNLTNWTLTTGRVRFNVRVGVAYGSPVRTVVQLLEEVAARHGRVLKEPEPEVLFEDFGNDSLVFALHYWLDIRAGTVARLVASDLRSMVEGSFADHGIVIAFPQRDVHLDAAQPLAVRIVREDQAAAPPTTPAGS